MIICSTIRTYLREFTLDDAPFMYQLNSNPEVLKYTGDKAFENEAAARTFLENYDQYRKYGLGRWALIDKTTHQFMGWCGLKYNPISNEYDIGFRLFQTYWNKGYASEAAQACLDWGFKRPDIQVILGRAMADNIGSIKVLEKIGLQYYKAFDFDGQAGVIYRIERTT